MKTHITGELCHLDDVRSCVAEYVKKYASTPGVEITIRCGTTKRKDSPEKTSVAVFVYKTEDTVLHGGTHKEFYNLEYVDLY